jgi:hypothetical protein
MAADTILRRGRVLARIARSSVRHAREERRQRRSGSDSGPDAVLLVLGCQRSGTTMMTRVLDRDPDAKVYPEQSVLTLGDRDEYLRLPATPQLADRIATSHFPLVVLKPLVESQNAPALLSALPNARALWMFRHWADVARSNLARFGQANGIRNLRRVIERRAGDWRSEDVPESVRSVIAEHYSESMNPWDAAALFWWVRNSHFFELGLTSRPDVQTCRYEELVEEPERIMRGVYGLLNRPFPGQQVVADVSTASVGLGVGLEFSPSVIGLCNEMHTRLRAAHQEAMACA